MKTLNKMQTFCTNDYVLDIFIFKKKFSFFKSYTNLPI